MSEEEASSDSQSPPPPADNTSGSNSPPPPPPSSNSNDDNSSSSSPPPPSDSSSTPPPPPDSSSNPPPPPPSDNSPPPPTPPSNDNNNNNNNDNNNDNSPPPPPRNNNNDNNNKSPPPPPPPISSRSPHPPPPPSRHSGALSPPKGGGSTTTSESNSSDGGAISAQQKQIIAGVAAGAGLMLLVMIVFVAACAKRKKRKPSRDQMGYYRDNSNGIRNDYYNSGTQQGNWNNNKMMMQSADYTVKMPPPPPSGQVSSEQGWPIAPPPPPPMMFSSEMSSAAFSGPYNAPLPPPHPAVALGFNQSSFSYDDLAAATKGFAKEHLLGQGGFGYVHKGVLPNGKEIAVKSLKANSGQGEREFQAEVDIISRVHHRHLVSLVGYCIAGSQRMLVYEFVENNTLEYHLYESGQVMDFATRHAIALGSAKGFSYLHEDCHPRIIHRDIKAANILIDCNFEAKVADFGLAKLASDNNTHVSTRIMGTFGYLAPEYASSGKLTEKSDVYSFGVVLLELITGKRPMDVNSDDDTLVEWARPILMKAADGGGFEELVDPRLENKYDYQQMLAMVACAGASIRHSARKRPKMSQIVRALEGDVSLEDLTEGMKLGHSGIFGGSSGGSSSEYDSSIQMKKAGGLMSSQELSSGEYVHSSAQSQEIPSTRGQTP